MDPRDALKAALAPYPALRWTEENDGVRVDAPNEGGFTVAIHQDGEEWVVVLGEGGFHMALDDGEQAFGLAAWCLSGSYRLREVRRGRYVQKVVLEAREDERWRAVSVTGFFVPPWRGRRSEALFQNDNILGG